MYQWFILVKYQKYIFLLRAQKSPLSGGLMTGAREAGSVCGGAGLR